MEKNNIAQDYIDGMLKITSTPMLFVIVAGGLLGGLVGSIIGQKLLNKHFGKAGLVSVIIDTAPILHQISAGKREAVWFQMRG